MKKFFLSVLFVLFMTPITYASIVFFTAPSVHVEKPDALYRGKAPNRDAYKPYSGAILKEHGIGDYSQSSKIYLKSVSDDFQNSSDSYDKAFVAVDEVANDFDALVLSGFDGQRPEPKAKSSKR